MGLDQKKRGIVSRKRIPIILIQAEGKNKTERIYFDNYRKNRNYRIVFAKGNYTDPSNMIDNLKLYIKKYKLSVKDGDRAYCIFDTDTSISKQKQIDKAFDENNKLIEIIISNPCIEFWFLIHFRKTTKMFNSSLEVEKELKKYIPNYEKNTDCFSILSRNTTMAIENAKQIERHHLDLR